MSEFSVHHGVDRLLKLLSVDESQNECMSKAEIVERFEKSRNETRNTTSTKFADKMTKHSNPLFRDKHLNLKSKNPAETDNFANLLARIEDNSDVLNFLRFHKLYANHKKAKNDEIPRSFSSLKSLENQMMTTSRSSLKLSIGSPMPLIVASDTNGEQQTPQEFRSDDIFRKMTYDFGGDDDDDEVAVTPLATLSKESRENALIDDLFYVLIGISGVYIKAKKVSGRVKILVSDVADVIEKTMCQRITKICSPYSQLTTFMDCYEFEGFDSGRVNQALVSCIRCVIQDYFRHLTDIEMVHKRGALTLQKMWYYLESNISNFDILCDVCDKVRRGECGGGAVISILHEKIVSLKGNAKACDFLVKIATTACEPYFNMLVMWLTEGTVHDPHKEFCIEDKMSEEEDMNNDSWKDRFTIVNSRLPIFLTKYSEKILLTGKYLSIIKQFGQPLEQPCDTFKYTTDERVYGFQINTAYVSSSRQIFSLLIKDFKLVDHFKAIKSYFFMDKGDFILHFMEIAEKELNKQINDINPTAVQSLLELSVRTSVMATNPFTDNLGIEFADESLLSQVSNLINQGCNSMLNCDDMISDTRELFGFESLVFSYNVDWPLSLILHKGSLGFYQMLFRLVFICKYIERSLGDLWKFNKGYKSSSLKSLGNRSNVFGLQQKMLYFVQNIEYYLMFEVIEPKFMNFISAVETKIDNFDELLKVHESFCEELSKDCMLSNIKALNLISNILDLCLEFTRFMSARNTECTDSERTSKMHADFNENLNNLLREISDTKDMFTTNLVDILCKLDFNEFYAKVINGF